MARRAIAVVSCVVALVAAGACGKGEGSGGDTHGARVEHFHLASRAVGRRLRETLVVPGGASGRERRPLLVFLHGRGGDEDSQLDDAMFAALRRLGARAPVIVFPNGGEGSYWHDRRQGRWGTYVLSEVIPEALRRSHGDPRRVAVGGISMGGFGAYDLARLDLRRFCAVGGHSPALWTDAGQTAPGAFDDAEDFSRHDVIGALRGNPGAFGSARVWLDAGVDDPFDPGDRAFVAALGPGARGVTVHRFPGAHTHDYWASHWGDYLSFYAAALATCGRG